MTHKPDTEVILSEVILLRVFYATWTEFHSVPRDRLHRRQHEIAAQDLVDAHNGLKRFYEQHVKSAVKIVSATGETIGAAANEVDHAGT